LVMRSNNQARHSKGTKEGGRFKADVSGRTPPRSLEWRPGTDEHSNAKHPTEEEIETLARQVANAYALFSRGKAQEINNQSTWSLIPALEEQENEATGQIDISIPPGLGDSASNVLTDIEAELSPSKRRRFRKKVNALASSLSYSEMSRGDFEPDESVTNNARRWWALFSATLKPSTALTTYTEDGTTIHSFLFIAKEWNRQVETLLSSAGQNNCSLSGEICFPESAYTLHEDAGAGVVFHEAEVEEEFDDE